jgi:hypothetical protein
MVNSGYQLPIFISSPEYNLTDLRAELGNFLNGLGYTPILSSEAGFPDSTPDMSPWESCIPVLDSCHFVVLVLDGRYGSALEWKHYKELTDEPISPTHGEYRYAIQQGKRLLVYVRKSVMGHYQTYRTALKTANNDTEACKATLAGVLPKTTEFKALGFIHEVKITDPIPWIIEFDNVVDIKTDLKQKLINELASVFMHKQKHLDAVIQAFDKIVMELPADKREAALKSIGVTGELIKKIEALNKEKDGLQLKLADLDLEYKKAKDKHEQEKLLQTSRVLIGAFDGINKEISQKQEIFFNSVGQNTGSFWDMNKRENTEGVNYDYLMPDTYLGGLFVEPSKKQEDGVASLIGSWNSSNLIRGNAAADGTVSLLGLSADNNARHISEGTLNLDPAASTLTRGIGSLASLANSKQSLIYPPQPAIDATSVFSGLRDSGHNGSPVILSGSTFSQKNAMDTNEANLAAEGFVKGDAMKKEEPKNTKKDNAAKDKKK